MATRGGGGGSQGGVAIGGSLFPPPAVIEELRACESVSVEPDHLFGSWKFATATSSTLKNTQFTSGQC